MPSIMRHINVIGRCAAIFRADKIPDGEISACQHTYVLTICNHPGISQEQLARHIPLNKSNVTRTLAALEKKGYVTRCQSETDKRVTLVYPTQKMHDIYPRIKAVADEWNAYLISDLTEQEKELFQKTLIKISKRAAAYVESKEKI